MPNGWWNSTRGYDCIASHRTGIPECRTCGVFGRLSKRFPRVSLIILIWISIENIDSLFRFQENYDKQHCAETPLQSTDIDNNSVVDLPINEQVEISIEAEENTKPHAKSAELRIKRHTNCEDCDISFITKKELKVRHNFTPSLTVFCFRTMGRIFVLANFLFSIDLNVIATPVTLSHAEKMWSVPKNVCKPNGTKSARPARSWNWKWFQRWDGSKLRLLCVKWRECSLWHLRSSRIIRRVTFTTCRPAREPVQMCCLRYKTQTQSQFGTPYENSCKYLLFLVCYTSILLCMLQP